MGDATGGAVGESMAEFALRRRRETENFGQSAEAAARDAYGWAIRAGEDLNLPTSGEVARFGANLLNKDDRWSGEADSAPMIGRTAAGAEPTAGSVRRYATQVGNWMDRSPAIKRAAGDAARIAGVVPGALRGAWHTARDIGGALNFGSRLFDPMDAEFSSPGEAAWDEVVDIGKGVIGYAARAVSDPMSVAHGIGGRLGQLEVATNPDASPPATTVAGEAARNFNIGLNQGEGLFDLGALAYGGGQAKAVSGFGKAVEAEGAAKYLKRGYPAGISAYFAEPYLGGGHHYLPKRTTLPSWLGGGPVPPAISDSPFFLLRPRGVTNGDFFERHVKVDPRYGGGKLPAKHGGGGWSGKALGWQKYDRAGRIWNGAPPALKAVAGAGVVGAGAAVDQASNARGQR